MNQYSIFLKRMTYLRVSRPDFENFPSPKLGAIGARNPPLADWLTSWKNKIECGDLQTEAATTNTTHIGLQK